MLHHRHQAHHCLTATMRRPQRSSPPSRPPSTLPLFAVALALSLTLPCLASQQQQSRHRPSSRAPVILSDLFNRTHLPFYRLSPRAVHTYSDLTVAIVFEILPPLRPPHTNNRPLRLHPFITHVRPPTASVNDLATLVPLQLPLLAIVRFHRVTTAVRWALVFSGLQPGSAASLLEPRIVHYPHLFFSARRAGALTIPGASAPSPSPSSPSSPSSSMPSVLARITRGGRLVYFKMIDIYSNNQSYSDANADGEKATILTNRIRFSTTTTASGTPGKAVALLSQYSSHASVLLVDAQRGDVRDDVKLPSRSKKDIDQQQEYDSNVDAHRVLDHDMWRSTTCTLGAVYASSVLPATGLRLQCHDLRQQQSSMQHIGLKRATTRAVLQFSHDLSTTPASAFARGAKLVILPGTKSVCLAASSSSSSSSTIAGRGITAVTLYERAFNFDWHSRDLDASTRAHELIVSVCTSCRHRGKVTASRCDDVVLALPEAAAAGGVDALSPLFTVFDMQKVVVMKRGAGVRRRRRKRSVVALFATTVRLTGRVNKADGQWTMEVEDEVLQSGEGNELGGGGGGHTESTWMLVVDLESLTPQLMRVDPQVVGDEEFNRLRVNAFRVTTSNSKIVLAGLVEGGSSAESGRGRGRVDSKNVTKQQLRSSLYAGGLMTFSVLL